MGLAGVPIALSRDDIINALKKCDGVVTKAARELKIHKGTIYSKIKGDEEIKQLLVELRHGFDEEMLDSAENVLRYAISQAKEDLNAALKSACFTLNNKGKSRGYSHPRANDESDSGAERSTVQLAERVQALETTLRSFTAGGPSLENEQPVLHQEQRWEEDSVRDELGSESPV